MRKEKDEGGEPNKQKKGNKRKRKRSENERDRRVRKRKWKHCSGKRGPKGRSGPWERAKCKSPQYYEGFAINALIEEQLICDKTEEAAKFKVNPDIQFRDIKK